MEKFAQTCRAQAKAKKEMKKGPEVQDFGEGGEKNWSRIT